MDAFQAIAVLKKGTYLLKYGRWGKPKFCPFWLSNDERLLIWYAGKVEKQLKLSHVTKIIPGQHTAIFKRYPQPEKQYQSFSLIYGDRSLDVICKDKVEAEVWIVALRALISQGKFCRKRSDEKSDNSSPRCHTRKNSASNVSSSSSDIIYKDPDDSHPVLVPYETSPQNRLGKAFSEVLSFAAAAKAYTQAESVTKSISYLGSGVLDDSINNTSPVDAFRVSCHSNASSSGYGSSHEDFDAAADILLWGEGIGNGPLSGNSHNVESSSMMRTDALLPKSLDTPVMLDAQIIACGANHAVVVTKQGQIFSWGEGRGGKHGHGVDTDISQPELVHALTGSTILHVACGEYHTCAVTISGNLFTWGDDSNDTGVLGYGTELNSRIPRRVIGQMENEHAAFVSCGSWHTAVITSQGKLFTFGDGTFGALGHGNRCSTSKPREVESLKGQRTLQVSCGIWHTAAVVTNENERCSSFLSGKLFTWGDGDKGQLGHGDEETRLVPFHVSMPEWARFTQVACGNSLTIALTASGHVYAMGSADFGQLGNPLSIGKLPTHVDGGDIRDCCIEQIACGSHHVVALNSNGEVYTWGKGKSGQLGHGDVRDKHIPTLVKALKNRPVKSIACGSNFTAVICPQKCVSDVDQSICTDCQNPFNFRRKRHNCYNCGLVFCKACRSKKSLKAALAPDPSKPSHVCDECFVKLKATMEYGSKLQWPKICRGSFNHSSSEIADGKLRSKPPHPLSRLSSFDSFGQTKRQYSPDKKVQLLKCSTSLTKADSCNGEVKCAHEVLTELSASVPSSRTLSESSSPVSKSSIVDSGRTSFTNYGDADLLPDTQNKESFGQEMILSAGQDSCL